MDDEVEMEDMLEIEPAEGNGLKLDLRGGASTPDADPIPPAPEESERDVRAGALGKGGCTDEDAACGGSERIGAVCERAGGWTVVD